MNEKKLSVETIARNWLANFEYSVRTHDFDRGKELFSSEMLGFGTIVNRTTNLQELAEKQWKPVWKNTEKFSFIGDTLSIFNDEQASTLILMLMWQSYGVSETNKFLRIGRCTIVLKKSNDDTNNYKAIHSHFSKTPDGSL